LLTSAKWISGYPLDKHIAALRRSVADSSRRFIGIGARLIRRFAEKRTWLILFVLGASGILYRVNIHEPFIANDSKVSMRLAENLVINGCYSISDPRTAECRPTWGAQPPGYPTFIAALKLTGYGRPSDVVIAQVVIFALAVMTLLAISTHWTTSATALFVPGILLMASPLTAGFSPYVLTETVAAASTLVMFAALAYSLHSGQLSIFFTALALLGAALVRWDQLSLICAVGFIAFHLHSFRAAILRIIIVFVPTLAIYASLMIRAALVGLPLIPGLVFDNELPSGILKFWQVTTVTQNANGEFLWRVWGNTYKNIPRAFDYGAIAPRINTPQLHELINRLGEVPEGRPVPEELDAEFGALAADFQVSSPVNAYGLVPLMRAWYVWTGKDELWSFGWTGPAAGYEGSRLVYRIFLLLFAILLLIRLRTGTTERALIGAVVLYVISRTVFLVMLTAVELRYLVAMIPPLEFILFFVFLRRVNWSEGNRKKIKCL
jgi:hypothetical protein